MRITREVRKSSLRLINAMQARKRLKSPSWYELPPTFCLLSPVFCLLILVPDEGIEPLQRDFSNLVMARGFWRKGLILGRLVRSLDSSGVLRNPQVSTP